MGKAVKSVAAVAAPLSGGLLAGGGKDLLFGKVQGGVEADPITGDIRATNVKALGIQREGLDRLDKISKQDPAELVNRQLGSEKNFAIQGAQDARRRIQELAARRGMSRSSIPGLSESTLTNGLANNLGQIEGQRANLMRNAEIGNAQLAFQPAIQVSQANPMNVPMQDIAGKRNGGISGLLGAAAGGAMGGPQGAGVGYQAGQGMGGIFG